VSQFRLAHPGEVLMTTEKMTACACTHCVGAGCTCGCQGVTAPAGAGCQCGCQQGKACACAKAEPPAANCRAGEAGQGL